MNKVQIRLDISDLCLEVPSHLLCAQIAPPFCAFFLVGFLFENFTPDGMRWAIDQALRVYADRPSWKLLMSNAMAENFSWETQAQHYVEVYSWLVRL